MATSTVEEWMVASPEQQDDIIKDFASSIDLDVYTIPDLLEAIRPYIQEGSDLVKASRALQALAPVFSKLQSDVSRIDTSLIVQYFSARLHNQENLPINYAGVGHIAALFRVLATRRQFPPQDAATIMSAIFSLAGTNNFFAIQMNSIRLTLFELVAFILQKYERALKRDLGAAEMVSGVVAMMQSEKNPDCLAVGFPIYTALGQTSWNLGGSELQKIWESFVRYIPISVSSRDTAGPTREYLRDLLLKCTISNDFYADEAIVFLLERLDTTTDISADLKLDILRTLESCVKNYSVEKVSKLATKVWDSVKFEVTNGEHEEFIQASLRVLKSMTSTLSHAETGTDIDWSDEQSPLATFLHNALGERILKLQDSRDMQANAKFFRTFSESSPQGFFITAKKIIPALNLVWQGLSLDSEKNLLLGNYNALLGGRLELVYPSPSEDTLAKTKFTAQMTLADSALAKFRAELVDVFFGAVTNVDDTDNASILASSVTSTPNAIFGASAIRGLVFLTILDGLLSDAEEKMVVEKLVAFSFNKNLEPDVATEVMVGLAKINAALPEIFAQVTLPLYRERIPVSLPRDADMEQEIFHLNRLAEIACTIPCKRDLREKNKSRKHSGRHQYLLFNMLVEYLLENWQSSLQENLEYANVFLACIAWAVQTFDSSLSEEAKLVELPVDPTPKFGPYTPLILSLSQVVKNKLYEGSADGETKHWYVGLAVLHGQRQASIQLMIQLVGEVFLLVLHSEFTTPDNNPLLEPPLNTAQMEPSRILSLFKDRPTQEGEVCLHDLASYQSDCVAGQMDKAWANCISVYLLAAAQPQDAEKLGISAGDTALSHFYNAISAYPYPPFIQMAFIWSLQLYVNKFGAASHQFESVDKPKDLLGHMEAALRSLEHVGPIGGLIYRVLVYFTAAALACGHGCKENLLKHMILGITHDRWGHQVAQSFRLLLAPSEFMNETNHCTLRPMRKFRLFSLMQNELFPRWQRASTTDLRSRYLIAIAGILAQVDTAQLVEAQSNLLMPILLEGTSISGDEISKQAFLSALGNLMPHRIPLFEEHLGSIISRMLARIRNTYVAPSDSSIPCRVLALDILIELLAYIDFNKLRPYAAELGREIDWAKDDSSYEVREKAATFSFQWLFKERDASVAGQSR